MIKRYIVRADSSVCSGKGVYTYANATGGTETEWTSANGVSRKDRLSARKNAYKWLSRAAAQHMADELNGTPFFHRANVCFSVIEVK